VSDDESTPFDASANATSGDSSRSMSEGAALEARLASTRPDGEANSSEVPPAQRDSTPELDRQPVDAADALRDDSSLCFETRHSRPPPAPALRPSANRTSADGAASLVSTHRRNWGARAWLPALAVATCAGSYCLVAQWMGTASGALAAESGQIDPQPTAASSEGRVESSSQRMGVKALQPSAASTASVALRARTDVHAASDNHLTQLRTARAASKSPARSNGSTFASAALRPRDKRANDLSLPARPKDRGF
jgi:hypothetical protein